MKVDLSDLVWLAGLIEGDGHFSLTEGRPIVGISMKDEDVIDRLAKMWETSYSKETPRKKGWSPVFKCSISGKKALVWMRTMLPYLGARRSEKVKRICHDFEKIREARLSSDPNAETFAFQRFDKDALRREYGTASYRDLGKKYGVSHETIRRIILDLDNRGHHRGERPQNSPLIHSLEVCENISAIDLHIHWFAGLLEAEGSFMKGTPSRPGSPIVSLQMTDEDVVEKARRSVASDRKVNRYQKSQKDPRHKDVFMWQEREERAFIL